MQNHLIALTKEPPGFTGPAPGLCPYCDDLQAMGWVYEDEDEGGFRALDPAEMLG